MVIKIEYQPWREGLTKEQIVRFSNEAVESHGNAFAEDIIRRFQKWFSEDPGLGRNKPIYETGETMRAFKAEGGIGRGGIVNVSIREGGNAPFVRKGLQPGTTVSLERLKVWAARKNIKLVSYADYKSTLPGEKEKGRVHLVPEFTSRSSTGKSFTVKEHGRAERDKKDIVNSALRAIQKAIKEEGTDRPGANWMPYFPTGKGQFDYPRYLVVARRKLISDLADRHAAQVADALVSFWNSAGKQKVYDIASEKGDLGGIRQPRNPRRSAID